MLGGCLESGKMMPYCWWVLSMRVLFYWVSPLTESASLPRSISRCISDVMDGVTRKITLRSTATKRWVRVSFATLLFFRCEQNHPGTECAVQLVIFAARVDEVKHGLAQANVTAAVVMRDERDNMWCQMSLIRDGTLWLPERGDGRGVGPMVRPRAFMPSGS